MGHGATAKRRRLIKAYLEQGKSLKDIPVLLWTEHGITNKSGHPISYATMRNESHRYGLFKQSKEKKCHHTQT